MKDFKSVFLFFVTVCFLIGCEDKCVTSGNCSLTPDPGPCKAYIPRYYFDKEERICKEFIWGGCNGIVPFETMEACSICACE